MSAIYIITAGNQNVDIYKNQTINVGTDYSMSIGSNLSVDVGNNYDLNIAKDLNVNVGNNYNLNVGKKMNIECGDEVTVLVGKARVIIKKNGQIEIFGNKLDIHSTNEMNISGPKVTISGSLSLTLIGNDTLIV